MRQYAGNIETQSTVSLCPLAQPCLFPALAQPSHLPCLKSLPVRQILPSSFWTNGPGETCSAALQDGYHRDLSDPRGVLVAE